jgi:hypothetical protein
MRNPTSIGREEDALDHLRELWRATAPYHRAALTFGEILLALVIAGIIWHKLAIRDLIRWVLAQLSSEQVVRVAICALCVPAVVITILFHTFTATLWVPSLVCNLLTTAVAIYVVNIVIVGRQTHARSREQARLVSTYADVYRMRLFIDLAASTDVSRIRSFYEQDKEDIVREHEGIREFISTYRTVLDQTAINWVHELDSCFAAMRTMCDAPSTISVERFAWYGRRIVQIAWAIEEAAGEAPLRGSLLERLKKLEGQSTAQKLKTPTHP